MPNRAYGNLMGTNRTPGKLMGSGRQMVVAAAIGESVVYCAVAGKDMGSKRQLYGSSHSFCVTGPITLSLRHTYGSNFYWNEMRTLDGQLFRQLKPQSPTLSMRLPIVEGMDRPCEAQRAHWLLATVEPRVTCPERHDFTATWLFCPTPRKGL